MKNLFFALTLMFCSTSFAIDPFGSISASLRSVPFGGTVAFNLGLEKKLTYSSQEDSLLNGFVRAGARVETAIAYNSISPFLDFYPVSFVRFRISHEKISNSTKYRAYDCDRWSCIGDREKNSLEARFALAAKDLFLIFDGSTTKAHNLQQLDKDYIDPSLGSFLTSREDESILGFRTIAGYKYSEEQQFFIGHQYFSTSGSKGFSSNDFLGASMDFEKLKVIVSVGNFRSSLFESSFSASVRFEWIFRPSKTKI